MQRARTQRNNLSPNGPKYAHCLDKINYTTESIESVLKTRKNFPNKRKLQN